MNESYCPNCGEPTSGRHSLPVDDNGDVVGNAHVFGPEGMAAVPCCENCYNMHAACGNAPTEIVEAVLKAYERATESLAIALEDMRERVYLVAEIGRRTVDKYSAPQMTTRADRIAGELD